MIYLYFTLVILISSTIGFIVGKKITKKKIYKDLNKGTGRMGIIRVANSPAYGFIEIEEVDAAGEYTKVIIHNIFIDKDSSVSNERFIKTWGGNDWVRTNTIVWYDNNSQKIRDTKLKSILNES
jgi:hypothetical protein